MLFSGYGTISDCKMLPGRDAMSKPCALIRYSTVEQATWFVENLNGNIPEGLTEPIICRFANDSSQRKGYDKGFGKAAAFNAGASPLPPPGTAPPVRYDPYNGATAGKGAVNNMQGLGLSRMSHSFEVLFGAVQGSGVLGGGAVSDECVVMVQNLPFDTTDLDLYRLFSPFGALSPSGVKAVLDDDGSCKG